MHHVRKVLIKVWALKMCFGLVDLGVLLRKSQGRWRTNQGHLTEESPCSQSFPVGGHSPLPFWKFTKEEYLLLWKCY